MARELRKAVQLATLRGYQVDGEGLTFLRSLGEEEAVTLMEEAIKLAEGGKPKPIVIGKELLERSKERLEESKSAVSLKTKAPLAKEFESRVEILKDPTEKVSSNGSLEDFVHYFRSRFEKLREVLQRRIDGRGASTLLEALRSPQNSKVKFIAMIMEKRERGGKIFLKVEDQTASGTAVVFKDKRETYELAQKLVLDQVVCMEGVRIKNGLIAVESLVYPDLPERKVKGAEEEVSVALVGDIHCGSKAFLKETFEKLVLWLNGGAGNKKQREAAGRIKYLVVLGDLVDGVGVYPGQEKELEIADIYEQYRLVAKYLEKIPEYIEVITIPGNHDGARQALPQPAIPRELIEPVQEARKIVLVGNPAEVRLHGVSFLLYHGTSMNDLISAVPGLSYERPERGLELLLKIRHLAPIYGAGTPIAPGEEDLLVVEEPPDVFSAGHVHVVDYGWYKGSAVVSCGTWQAQTEYQRKLNVRPTPGVLPVIRLDSMQVNVVNFL
ncbi:TPA: DNA-directed DNA polymerase II small subunit [Candidatus Bathyarchaeota archaeon]|nr:DNA-directed DNA polymerase II small subunit [Candidatus Bathyarchaeota archaeon]